MKLKDFMSILFLDEQIEIKSTTALFVPENAKEVCHLLKTVMGKADFY